MINADFFHVVALNLLPLSLFTDILQYYLTCSVGQVNPFQQVIKASASLECIDSDFIC